VLEDVTATGSTILETAELVEDLGGVVERLIVVVDRNQGAVERVDDAGYELEFLVQVDRDLAVE